MSTYYPKQKVMRKSRKVDKATPGEDILDAMVKR